MKLALRILGLMAVLALSTPALRAADANVQLGLQTWTLRNMNFDQVVAFATKHKIKYLQLIGNHLDPNSPVEEVKRKKAILDEKGLVAYTFGVAGTSMDKEKNWKLFEFAKLMGIKLIVVEPRDLKEWDNLEELVKEYDIKLAIHNHGKGSVYGDPATVQKILKARDLRIGVCMDVGWVTGAGFDAAKVFEDYNGRVYDFHLKDKKVEKAADGKEVLLDVEVGTGAANYKRLFAAIKKTGWKGVMSIETDNGTFAKDPNEFVEKAAKFFLSQIAERSQGRLRVGGAVKSANLA
jgi:sugar phosphate isomerase/epimerase